MKRILAMLMAVIMLVAVCALTGCGDKEKTDPNTSSSKLDDAKDSAEKAAIQSAYEELFNDPTKMELNAKNVTGSMTANGTKFMEIQANESGDSKGTMYLSETLGYTTYTIGEDSYIEMHIPEHKNNDGKTVKAEDVYYKTKAAESTLANEFDINNIITSLQLSKENIKSVKYVETKNIEGVKCDVVEVVHSLTNEDYFIDEEEVDNDVDAVVENETKSDDSDKTSEDSGVAETIGEMGEAVDTVGEEDGSNDNTTTTEVTTTFYFTSDGKKLFGLIANTNGMQTECYFLPELTIELPKDVKFVDATDEQVSEKMMELYTAIYSQADSVGENDTEDSSSD